MTSRRSFFRRLLGGAAVAASPQALAVPEVDCLGCTPIIRDSESDMETRYIWIAGENGKLQIFPYQVEAGTWGGVKVTP
jgi:hypothetical protein